MNEPSPPESDLREVQITFRPSGQMEKPFSCIYRVTPDTLATMMRDWNDERQGRFAYPAFRSEIHRSTILDRENTEIKDRLERKLKPTTLMLWLSDVLFIG